MARVSLAYPKIPGCANAPAGRCIAFEKYDGTNLHWVWERELGWYAFGVRRNRYDLDERGIAEFNHAHPGLSESVEIFKSKFAEQLSETFRTNPAYQSPEITVFTEFFGPNSFAGMHKSEDRKRLVLFDVEIADGIIGPERFVDDFQSVEIARVIYRGKLTGQFTHDVRDGKYDVSEGVVCKGGSGGSDLWMVKIKTDAYMRRLKEAFEDDWESYWE